MQRQIKAKGMLAVLGIFLGLSWAAVNIQSVQAADNTEISELSQQIGRAHV